MTLLIKTLGYEIDTACIATHHQPAVLVEFALSRKVDSRQLLRSTRIQLEDFRLAEKRISPDQYLTLISNCRKLVNADDTSFLYGQRLWPGCFGAASQALQLVSNLRQAIEIICDFHAILSPLFTPRFYANEQELFIFWQDATGSDEQQQFLIEAHMTAFISMVSWLSKEKMPWNFEFTYSEPTYIEQYWVNLGQDLTFNQQMNCMRLPIEFLDKPWPNASQISIHGALKETHKQLLSLHSPQSFIDQLYDYIQTHIRQPLNLEKVSAAFGISPASMKRKLKKHHTTFQQQIDLARKNTAIYLFQVKHFNNQQIAEYLRFNDMNNYRRAFKRWTGLSPYTLF
ncbi:MAG: AraC family transcriptional regulator ligand-binding domain-containing protein [Methylophaga sp.]|uniref:AraC family transcriptional regulator n=1 Tax=Methylophaga sp. TaxID=2024840 RepID=UPI000C0E70D9|nr:AraC family transcriptional regulator [Methylophaga sp.]MBL1458386.1 AraC family transcriptional regulator ligand-binding domain-containing protein [Methylophaga sp.]